MDIQQRNTGKSKNNMSDILLLYFKYWSSSVTYWIQQCCDLRRSCFLVALMPLTTNKGHSYRFLLKQKAGLSLRGFITSMLQTADNENFRHVYLLSSKCMRAWDITRCGIATFINLLTISWAWLKMWTSWYLPEVTLPTPWIFTNDCCS